MAKRCPPSENSLLKGKFGLIVRETDAQLAYLLRARINKGYLTSYDALIMRCKGGRRSRRLHSIDATLVAETWTRRPSRTQLNAAEELFRTGERTVTLVSGAGRYGDEHHVLVPRLLRWWSGIPDLRPLGFFGNDIVRFAHLDSISLPEAQACLANIVPSWDPRTSNASGELVLYDETDLEEFTIGFVIGWLSFDKPPSAEAADGEEWECGDTYADAGFFYDDLTAESAEIVRAHCAEFLDQAAHLIPGSRSYFEGTEFEQAGHDFACSALRLAEGFDREEWTEPAKSELERLAAGRMLSIEPVKGKLHVG